ncbi:hypothetical protein BDV33DRAFT_210481 [Aspergillus novoparasiticus]|uniref:Uncharacterized protein n=1 Tax=Aspergillus novoparasiticus TaxID=986946 RepID=A0A5N6E794_9EURO|nr:hypothetical protein BDV33DRAFT_210481 [Aspergillus novoparasiticus]
MHTMYSLYQPLVQVLNIARNVYWYHRRASRRGDQSRPNDVYVFSEVYSEREIAWQRETSNPARIRTLSGDLLLAPPYRDRLYLRGIRVPETGWDHSAFRYGYNLISGSVERDRQWLLNASHVTNSIHAIWEEAISQDEAETLPRYLELFRTYPSSADVIGADRVVTEAVAKKLWASLWGEATAADVFYYPESRRNQDDPIIQSELRKKLSALPDLLWNILRKYDLVREPLEELHSRFRHSQEVDVPNTTFGRGVARTLRALLMLHPSTAGIRVVFVRCDAHTVDLAYRADEDALYVHEKWLHPSAAPAPPAPALSAGLERDATVDVFACQHVVEELYHRALTLVLGRPDGVRSGPSIWQLVQLAQQKLRQMACMVQASRTEVARTLKVSFYTGHSLLYVDLHGAQSHHLVVLHVAGCLSSVDNLIYSGSHDVCDCPRQSVSLLSRTVVFGNLSQGPWIPTVAKMRDSPGLGEERLGHPSMKAQDGTLIGVPPPAIVLSGWEDAPVSGEAGSASSACKTSAPNAVRETMPLAAAAVASAGSRPLVQMEDNHDVDEGDEALFEANTIADVGNFLGEIAQGIIVCGNEEPKDKAETSGADWALINPPFSSEATARSGEVGSGALLTNGPTATCKSEEHGTALSSMHQVVGDSSSPPSSAPWVVL